MYKLKMMSGCATVDVLTELRELRHLDVSDEPDPNGGMPFHNPGLGTRLNITELLQVPDSFPNLVSLDISGKCFRFLLGEGGGDK